MAWAEQTGLLELEQWTFQSYRRTIDAAVLISFLVETATQDSELPLEEADMEKAYVMAPREFSEAAI